MLPAKFKWKALSIRQQKVFKWWKSEQFKNHRGIIADGAIRSGKTVSMAMSFVVWSMHCFDDQDFAICGKTVGALKRNVIYTLQKQCRAEGYTAELKRSENRLIISKGNTVNNYWLFGGKDESSQDLIQGMTLAGVLLDEVALMPESFVNQATARCSVDGAKLWFNCNPAGQTHWFYKDWIKKCREKKLMYLHFTMEDNLTLSEDVKSMYRTQYTGLFYQRYIKGLWVNAEGLIYDMFDEKKHVIDILPERTSNNYYISSDFGIQNATVFLFWYKAADGRWIESNEYYYSGRDMMRQKTVSELVDDLEREIEKTNFVGKPQQIIVDPSASALIVELKKRGYNVLHALNDVIEGITETSVALNKNLVAIHRSCRKTIDEMQEYHWNKKSVDRGEDAPEKTKDHCMDAVRYFVKSKQIVHKDDSEYIPILRGKRK